MCDSTAPNSAATLIALANWFARYVTGSVIGLTTVPATRAYCATCGTDNPAPSHPCTPSLQVLRRKPSYIDPNCPRHARQTPNKAWVRKALKKEQRDCSPPAHLLLPKIWQRLDTHKSRLRGHCERVRSLARDPVRKSQTRSKSRSRSRGASMRPPEKRPPDQTAPPSQQPYKKALLTNASANVA
ncbi:hypothetical protein HPB51_024136 [Rhipicephalus microplus]|uniref:Uncharacterized protein n=1 Tax=Rhipicephalus microplus TaxID=6941 RepID=A0A9J6DKF7_RHIMP|nr:hypothetical protein HPB51_024136 [Rhipicephalus microplus]